ncbi:unnamed protein product, partial [Polarella glacialis]
DLEHQVAQMRSNEAETAAAKAAQTSGNQSVEKEGREVDKAKLRVACLEKELASRRVSEADCEEDLRATLARTAFSCRSLREQREALGQELADVRLELSRAHNGQARAVARLESEVEELENERLRLLSADSVARHEWRAQRRTWANELGRDL